MPIEEEDEDGNKDEDNDEEEEEGCYGTLVMKAYDESKLSIPKLYYHPPVYLSRHRRFEQSSNCHKVIVSYLELPTIRQPRLPMCAASLSIPYERTCRVSHRTDPCSASSFCSGLKCRT